MLPSCTDGGKIQKAKIKNMKILSSKSFTLLIVNENWTEYFRFDKCLCFFRKQVVSGRLEAERDGVVVPLTLEDYCKVSSTARSSTSAAAMDSDFYVEDYDLDVESDANSEDEYQDDATDSGNGESWNQMTVRHLQKIKQYFKPDIINMNEHLSALDKVT